MRTADFSRPPGWTYNPSSWSERLWMVGVAGGGVLVSGYLAFYQWGMLERVWEPFFGSGSEQVLDSFLSRVLPIPDAALGAIAYLLDAVTGLIGGRERWRTMPWMVLLFGLAVGPLGIVSVLLVIAQPVILNAWCSLCLVSAILSLVLIGPAMDEVLASLQYLRRVHEQHGSLWTALWRGKPQGPSTFDGSIDGKTGMPLIWWNHGLVALLGLWLMAAPDVMKYEGPERMNDHIVGPLIFSAAVIAVSETTRVARWMNVILGGWLIVAPIVLGYEPLHIGARSSLLGAAILILSFITRPPKERMGGGWSSVWSGKPEEAAVGHMPSADRKADEWRKAG
jgi:uncharacterized membrane protein